MEADTCTVQLKILIGVTPFWGEQSIRLWRPEQQSNTHIRCEN